MKERMDYKKKIREKIELTVKDRRITSGSSRTL
jgi:hypothetical protein